MTAMVSVSPPGTLFFSMFVRNRPCTLSLLVCNARKNEGTAVMNISYIIVMLVVKK